MKRCSKCQLMKPADCFYKHSGIKEGLRPDCKDCGRPSVERRSEKNKKYASTDYGKAKRVELARKHRLRNPVKDAARRAVSRAIRAGGIVSQSCESCGDEKAHAHHDDYSKPLDVRWLCRAHHAEWHKHNTPICPDQEQAAA